MAAIFLDGEEIQFAADSPGLWDSYATNQTAGKLTYVSTHPRTGNGCFRILLTNSAAYAYKSKTLPSAYTELYFQFSVYLASSQVIVASDGTTVALLRLVSTTGVSQITLGVNESTRVLEVRLGRQDGTLLGSGSTAVSADTMHLVELHVVISDTVGVVQARLNGVTEINLSSQDTNNAGGGDIKTFDLGVTPGSISSDGASVDAFFDDIVVNDTTGSVSNSWPNGAGIEKLTPNADGNYTAWTSTGGAVDYTEIDDVTTYGNLPDDDTTTILSSTLNQRTSVNLTPTTQAGTVEAVMLCTYAKNSAAGADEMGHGVRLSGVDYESETWVPATTYGWQKKVVTLNPATSARWTTSEIDGMEKVWRRAT